MFLEALIRILEGMNRDFGKGEITAITFHMHECNSRQIYGRVVRDGHDERFFKMDNNSVTFLSRKRRFKI